MIPLFRSIHFVHFQDYLIPNIIPRDYLHCLCPKSIYIFSLSFPTPIFFPHIMDEDLTASHWDDVLSPNAGSSMFANLGQSILAPPTNEFKDMHPFAEDENNEDDNDDDNDNDNDNTDDNEESSNPLENYNDPSNQATFGQDSSNYQSEQLNDLRKEERNEHKQQLLSELISDKDTETITEAAASPKHLDHSESLFNLKDSPIKLPMSPTVMKSAERRTISARNGLMYRSNPRARRHHSATILQHLDPEQGSQNDPLSSNPLDLNDVKSTKTVNYGETLLQETEAPLYDVASKKTQEDSLQELSKAPSDAAPRPSKDPQTTKLTISVGDPVKMGDITNAYIVYSIKTKGNNTENFPNDVVVTRRYKDFRWLYHQLQASHPGRIIPPPPTKQTYIGRFNENFIENRRLSLEKMLSKISNVPILCADADFVLFLTDVEFTCDGKERDDMVTSTLDDGTAVASVAATADASSGGFMSLFLMSSKSTEPDDYFTKKKLYIDDLESNLRRFHKSLELIGTQRMELTAVLDEISLTLEDLSALEFLKVTSDLLLGFSEVQLRLKENLDRINIQDQLTLGFTIEEYLRIIGSVNHVLDARVKIYHQLQNFTAELSKKEQQLEKVHRKYGTAPNERASGLQFEVGKLKQKVTSFEELFKNISAVIKEEIANFEFEKIEDFRNSVEIFIENSIESQKEAIELYETFYDQQNLGSV